MNINCDTPIENLLNLKAVKELANEYYNTIKKAIDELTSIISNEQNKGLSKEAFNINGDNMIYEKANAININLSIILLSLKCYHLLFHITLIYYAIHYIYQNSYIPLA